MADVLQDGAEIRPGDRLTVFFSATLGYGTEESLFGDITRVFSGTIFPVDKIVAPADLGAIVVSTGQFGMTGLAAHQTGLMTTLPNRNITVGELRDFVASRLGLISGLWNETVSQVVAGDRADEAAPFLTKNIVYIGLGLVAVIALGYLLAGLGSVGRVVKPA